MGYLLEGMAANFSSEIHPSSNPHESLLKAYLNIIPKRVFKKNFDSIRPAYPGRDWHVPLYAPLTILVLSCVYVSPSGKNAELEDLLELAAA